MVTAGEVILANHGTLLLTDFPEFRRASLEMVGACLRLGNIKLSRPPVSVDIPLYFDVFATATACPCGMVPCTTCTPEQRHRFEDRIRGLSAPFILD